MTVKELKKLLKDANDNDEVVVLQEGFDRDGWSYNTPIAFDQIMIASEGYKKILVDAGIVPGIVVGAPSSSEFIPYFYFISITC